MPLEGSIVPVVEDMGDVAKLTEFDRLYETVVKVKGLDHFESQHCLNHIPRIKFLWRAPKSRAHLDSAIQGRASAFGHIGPAPWWSA